MPPRHTAACFRPSVLVTIQALANLLELLRSEEQRHASTTAPVVQQQARGSKAAAQATAELTAVVSGALQQHQPAMLAAMLDGKVGPFSLELLVDR